MNTALVLLFVAVVTFTTSIVGSGHLAATSFEPFAPVILVASVK